MTVARNGRAIHPRGAVTLPLNRRTDGTPATAPVTMMSKNALALPVTVFLLSIAIPGSIDLGGFSLSPYRIVLLVMLLPCLATLLSGRAGPVRSADIAVLLFCLWYGVSFAVTEGLSAAIQPAGMNMVEVAGAYFLARCYIRSHDEFQSMIRTIFMILLVLLPIAAVEALTGRNMVAEFFGIFLNADDAELGEGVRWGLRRANSVFDHPILLGVAAATLIPLTHYVLGTNASTVRRWVQYLVLIALTLLSLSSAPIGLAAILIALMLWDVLLRSYSWRWHFVVLAVAIAYFGVEILSSQTPIEFYIHHFTFNGQTGWYRKLIWDYGAASVVANPLFGIGFAEWSRPDWMTPSIDNFWLVHFIRTGMPGGILMLAVFGLAAFSVAKVDAADNGVRRCQTAYLMYLFGLFFTGATVHFWGSALALFLFTVGSGLWMTNTQTGKQDGPVEVHPAWKPSRSPATADPGMRGTARAIVGDRLK